MTVLPQELQQHWTAVRPLLSIRHEHEYELTVERLNHLLDEVGTDEQQKLLYAIGHAGHAHPCP